MTPKANNPLTQYSNIDLSTFESPWKLCILKCFIIGIISCWWWWLSSPCNCLSLHPLSPNKSKVIIWLSSPPLLPPENLDIGRHWPFSWTTKLELLLLQFSCSFIIIMCPYIPIFIPTTSAWSSEWGISNNGDFRTPTELVVAPICAAFCNKAVADVTNAAVADPESWSKAGSKKIHTHKILGYN